MNRSLKYFLYLAVFFILIVFRISLFASGSPNATSSEVVVRQPDAKFIDTYRSDKAFAYLQPPPVETNFLQKFIDYLIKRFPGWKRYSKVLPVVFKVILWILVLFLLYIVITKTKLYKLFYTDKQIDHPDVVYASPDEQILDYDEAIRLQLMQQQYRQAIRLLYIKLINLLRSKDYIHYSKEKTNVDYLYDLTNNELKSQFNTITSIYNYVWYGDVEIVEDQYLRFEKSFQSFYAAINEKE